LEKIFGFKPTERTILYILKRFQEAGYSGQDKTALARTGRKKSLQKFRAVFSDILGREPFIEKNRRNVDVVSAVNYVLYEKIQGERVALEGLRLVLRNRKERAEW